MCVVITCLLFCCQMQKVECKRRDAIAADLSGSTTNGINDPGVQRHGHIQRPSVVKAHWMSSGPGVDEASVSVVPPQSWFPFCGCRKHYSVTSSALAISLHVVCTSVSVCSLSYTRISNSQPLNGFIICIGEGIGGSFRGRPVRGELGMCCALIRRFCVFGAMYAVKPRIPPPLYAPYVTELLPPS